MTVIQRLRHIAAITVYALCVLLSAILLDVDVAAAQPSGGEQVSVGDLESLAATIEDETKRQAFLADLRALIALRKDETQAETPHLSTRIADAAAETARRTRDGLTAAADFARDTYRNAAIGPWLQNLRTDAAARARGLDRLGRLLGVLVAGALAQVAVFLLLKHSRRRITDVTATTRFGRFAAILARSVLRLLPIAAFYAGGYLAYVLLDPPAAAGTVALQALIAFTAAAAIIAVADEVIRPRVAPVAGVAGSHAAGRAYALRWVRRIVIVGVFGYVLTGVLSLFGLPERGYDALLRALGIVVAIMAVVFVLSIRTRVAEALRTHAETMANRKLAWAVSLFASVWHLPAFVYIIGAAVLWVIDRETGLAVMLQGTVLSLLVVAAAALATEGVDTLRCRAESWSKDCEQPLSLRGHAGRYLPYPAIALHVLVAVAALALIAHVWGVDVTAWLDVTVIRTVIDALVSVACVLVVAVVVWEAVNVGTERYLSAAAGDDLSRGARSARLRTLLPLMRKALLIALGVIVVMVALSELGVNIAPLLAGVGVVGLAVGFGAQKLVQDVINGAFILIEDAVTIGDVVNVGGTGGVVEEMSIRSLQLRDLSGNVHVIPFSAVDTITNMTKLFSYYVLDIGVAYREDTDEVIDVCRRIVDEMRDDPEYAPMILEPLDVLGVDAFADSAVIIKARIKTMPIKQWAVGREFNRRMKKRFDELGIEMPFPHRTLYFGVDKAGNAPAARIDMEGGLPGTSSPSQPLTQGRSQAGPPAPQPSEPPPPPSPPAAGRLIDPSDGSAVPPPPSPSDH